MKNLNPVYLIEGFFNDHSNGDISRNRTIFGAGLGGAAGAGISKVLLKNVQDMKDFIISTNSPEECIKGLKGYLEGISPIASIASKCIKYCKKSPESYKTLCLKTLNNYYGTMFTVGTLGGAALGGLGGMAMQDF